MAISFNSYRHQQLKVVVTCSMRGDAIATMDRIVAIVAGFRSRSMERTNVRQPFPVGVTFVR